MPSLVQPYLKVSRAKEHLDALNAEIEAFFESKPYTVTSHDDLEAFEYVVTVKLADVPLRLASIAGDFICCLRSSLDHLAWQLALLTTSPNFPSNKVEFPIFGEEGPDTEGKINRVTKEIPPDAVAHMKSLQPYHHGPNFMVTHLWRLQALWNIDKHRHFTFRSGIFDIDLLGIKLPREFRVIEFDDGCIMRMPLSSKPDVNLEPRCRKIELRFGDLEQKIEVTVIDFLHMYEFIAEKLIPGFSRFFP